MPSIKQYADLLLKQNDKLRIVSCKDYDGFYLFTAYENENDLDPFYMISKTTGEIFPYTIAVDPDRYYKSKELLQN